MFFAAMTPILQANGAPQGSADALFHAIAETGVKHAMIRCGITPTKFERIHNEMDFEIQSEHSRISQIVLDQTYKMLHS